MEFMTQVLTYMAPTAISPDEDMYLDGGMFHKGGHTNNHKVCPPPSCGRGVPRATGLVDTFFLHPWTAHVQKPKCD